MVSNSVKRKNKNKKNCTGIHIENLRKDAKNKSVKINSGKQGRVRGGVKRDLPSILIAF